MTGEDGLQRLLGGLVEALVEIVVQRYREQFGTVPSTTDLEVLRRYLTTKLSGRWAS